MAKKTAAPKAAPSPPKPAGPETVTFNQGDDDHDKSFMVETVNVEDSAMVIDGCCDEGEAIRCYCVTKRMLPNKFRFTAVLAS